MEITFTMPNPEGPNPEGPRSAVSNFEEPTPERPAPEPVTIVGATVIDGSGAPGFRADVVLEFGLISKILREGEQPPATSRIIEASGLVLSPGFIDMHAHSDLQILLEPGHYAKLSQGVTTEVLGQDGISYAPIDTPTLTDIRAKIAAWNDNPDDFDFSWRTVGEYLDRLDQGIAVNAAYLIPQGTVRAMVCGFGDVQATPEQAAAQQDLIRQGMEQGAVGMSSGLTYTPGMYADDAELAGLCEVVAHYEGFYSPHHRSYGRGALEAYAEMIALTRRSKCALHLTHATMNFAPNAGRAGELLELIDSALESGSDITLDTYPYLPGATTLSALLPSWASAGGVGETLSRLVEPETVARIRESVEIYGSDGCHGVVTDWDTIEISGTKNPELTSMVGKTIAAIAAERSVDAFEVFIQTLIQDRLGTGILQHVGHEDNVQEIMKHRTHTGGSDGILVGAKPHPRAWGTFPRYIAHYSRELGLLSLPEMIHHLSGRPAQRLRLINRGLIRAGYAADLVLFDPETIADTATFANPRQAATGIHYVFVNGVAAIAAGVPTGTLSGRALRRTSKGTCATS